MGHRRALLFLSLSIATAGNTTSEKAAELKILCQFYNNTVGTDLWKRGCADGRDANGSTIEGWRRNPDDCSNPDYCSWEGIKCTGDSAHLVQEIYIGACNLIGTIPEPSIFTLKRVRKILISAGPNVALSGHLPGDLSNETVLEVLQLTGHSFSGALPLSLTSCRSLTTIDLHSNKLTGSLPTNLGNLNNLAYLSLADNQLHGSLPRSLQATNDKAANPWAGQE
jgi:hypothetical protein